MARPSKLTPDLQERFVRAIRHGNWIETACDLVGIHPDTYYEWMRRAEAGGRGNQRFTEFSEAVRRARAEAEIESVARIRLAGSKGNLRADIFFLERSFPARWGRQRLELTGKDGEPLHPPRQAIDLTQASDDELAALEQLLTKLQPQGGSEGR